MEHWFLDQELMGQSQMQFLFCITSCSWIQTRAHIKRMINKDTAQQHAEPQPGPGPAQRATQGFSTVLLLHGDSRQGQVSRPSQPDSRTDRKAETPYELSSERWRFTRQYLTAFKGPPTNVAMSLHNYSGVRDTRMIWWRTSVLQQLHSKTLKLKGGGGADTLVVWLTATYRVQLTLHFSQQMFGLVSVGEVSVADINDDSVVPECKKWQSNNAQ